MSKRTIELLLKATNSTGPALSGVKKDLSELERITSGLKRTLQTVGVGASVGMFTSIIKDAIEAGSKIDDMSVRLGVGARALSAYKYAAELSGTSLEAVGDAIRFSQRAMAEQNETLGNLVGGFQNLRSLSPEAAFEKIVMSLAEVTDQTERMRIAMDVFGRGGGAMLNLVDGFGALIDSAYRLNLVMEDDVASGLAKAGDAMDRLRLRTEALRNEFASKFGPTIIVAVGMLEQMIKSGDLNPEAAAWALMRGGDKKGAVDWRRYKPIIQGVARPMLPGILSYQPGAPVAIPAMPESMIEPRALDAYAPMRDDLEVMMEFLEEWNQEQDEIAEGQRMAAEYAADYRAELERAREIAIDQAVYGVADIMGFISSDTARWANQLVRVYQLYKSIQALVAAIRVLGLFHAGGEVPGMAFGGAIPRAAAGMVVPDGPRGMDSRLIAAMPGEGVIRRDTMMRLERFLAAYESRAAFSPRTLGGRRDGAIVVNMNVARPVSRSDALELGRAAYEATREYERRFLG